MNSSNRSDRPFLGYMLASLVAAAVAAPQAAAELRTWTDSTGKFKIEAEFLEILDGQVRLKRQDGKTLSLALSKLSNDDQAYLRELMKRRRDGLPDSDNPFDAGVEADGAAGGRSRGNSGGEVVTENGLRVGDHVEVRDRGDWVTGVITGSDSEWNRIYVKLDGTNRTVESHDGEFWIRPAGGGLAPAVDGGVGFELEAVDVTNIRRILPLGGETGSFQPDPAPSTAADWRPRPVALSRKTGFFEDVTGMSFSALGGRAVVSHTGGSEPGDESSRIELCDLKSGRVLGNLPAPAGLKHIALSPAGTRLITVSEVETFTFGPLQLWEIDGQELKHLKSWHVSSDKDRRQVEWIGWADDERIMTVDDKGLTMWSISGPTGVYQVTGDRMQAPAFSPGRKQFAVGTDKGLSIHDVESGELLTRIAMDGFGFSRQVAFSPSGKLLAVTGSSTVLIYDATTGKKVTEAYAGSAGGFSASLCWLNEEQVLVGGSDVIHLPSQMTVWKYQHHAEQVVPLAGRVWYVFGGHGDESLALLPFQLPHPAVKPVADSELVLRPGDQVSIELELMFDLGTDPGGNQISPHDQLKAALTEAGFSVVDNSNKRLVGRTTPGETKEIHYRMFGAPFGQTQTASYTQRVFELELVVDGEIVWQRRRVIDAPMHLQLQENEGVDQAIQRNLLQDTGFFRSTVPSRVLPTAAEQARTSTLSIDGIE